MDLPVEFKKFDFRYDSDDLFAIMLGDEQFLIHSVMQINTRIDFEKWLAGQFAHNYHDFYVLRHRENRNLIGFIYSYEYSTIDLNCRVCCFLNRQYRDVGFGAVCTMKFVDELFSKYPLRKVYADIYDYNEQSLKSIRDSGFTEEVCFKAYRYYNGRYYDMHTLGLGREKFYEVFGTLLERKNG